MTERTLREKIAGTLASFFHDHHGQLLAAADAILQEFRILDAHTAAQPAPAHIAAAACTCGNCGGLVCCQNCGTPPQPAPDAVAEADAERVAAALWREEAAEGTPKSVMERRTPESFRSMLNTADQERWMRKGRAAVAALAKGPSA